MDRAMPTRAIRLFRSQAGVLLPSQVNEVHGAVRATRPRERRDCVDDRSEYAERVPNLTRHRFAGFSSAHRATNLDSRTLQHASDTILFPSTISGNPTPCRVQGRRRSADFSADQKASVSTVSQNDLPQMVRHMVGATEHDRQSIAAWIFGKIFVGHGRVLL
jgi:hypothetical protein